jgi:hypothetical protein
MRAIAVLSAAVSVATVVACAGRTPVHGPGYDPQRAALQSWAEDSAMLRTGPHAGQMVSFASVPGCISLVMMEVGQGRICPVRLRRFLPVDSSEQAGSPGGRTTHWRDEPLDETPEVWSSDTSVVIASPNGSLVARRPGQAIIRATVGDARWLMYVTVVPAIESFRWEPSTATLRIGETIKLRPVARDSNGRELPMRPRINAWGIYGGGPGMVRLDTAPGWRDLMVHAVSPGRIEIRAAYGARSATASITVLTDSATKVVAKRETDSVNAFVKSHLPVVRVHVFDEASNAPIAGARVEVPAWSLAATSDANGVASILGARVGPAALVVRCPWQRRTGPVATTRNFILRPTTDTTLRVSIPGAECVEVDSHSTRGEITGHILATLGGRIFIPCTPFDSLPLPPGVKRQTARVIVADSLLRGKPSISGEPLFVRWAGIAEGPGPYDDLSLAAPYKFTAIAISEMRPAMIGDCRR